MIKICRRYITRNGQKVFPPPGQKAFCFEVTEEQNKAYWERKNKQKDDGTNTEQAM